MEPSPWLSLFCAAVRQTLRVRKVSDYGKNSLMIDPIDVVVATPYGTNGMGGIDRLNDSILAEMHDRPNLGVVCHPIVTRGKGGLLAAQPIFAMALLRFASLVASNKADLVHIHLSGRGSTYRKAMLARAARLFSKPYVLQLHGTDYREFWEQSHPTIRHEIDQMFLHASRTIVLGDYWSKVVLDRLPSLKGKVIVLKNATKAASSPSRPAAASEPLRITFLGQLGSRKGSAEFLSQPSPFSRITQGGWRHLPAMVPSGKLGNKPTSLDWRRGSIYLAGWNWGARDALLQNTDVLVLPSRAENLPMVILEAFAYGVPVVSTPVGAIPEVVKDGHNGLLVEPGDIVALSRAIGRLIDDRPLRQRMGEAALIDHGRYFDLSVYAEALAGIWRGAVARYVPNREFANAHN